MVLTLARELALEIIIAFLCSSHRLHKKEKLLKALKFLYAELTCDSILNQKIQFVNKN